ncbi:transposase [Psychroflexus sp. MES1-P1E]|uniref:transposase n=1 Tax=Psychroflexus sp. MES1-P1E TaxID=2058320 RepID=UPI000C7E6FBB|nr:transposase [Psychroflexus sp. MES1-P1E]PKG41565.1 hypothetical protein CXF67_14905 [Psychroflexus sp. MES1-P1E]
MLLKNIPEIGEIVACCILFKLGNLPRFGSLKYLAGYVGIAPGIHQSDDDLKTIGITKRSHRLILSYFIETSWQSICAKPVMQADYPKHQGKNIKSIIKKVVRKLLSRNLAIIKI